MPVVPDEGCRWAAIGGCSDLRLFRAMADTSLDGIGICALPEFRFEYVNDAFARITGIPCEELLGRVVRDFDFGPNDADYRTMRELFIRDGFLRNYVVDVIDKQGGRTTVTVSAVLQEQAGIARALWMMHDITELKRNEAALRAEVVERTLTEERLRESEAIVRKIVEVCPDSVTIARLADGALRNVNDAFVEQFGFTREEALGRSALQLGIWERRYAMEFLGRLSKETVVRNFLATMRRKDGTEVPYLASAVTTQLGSEQCVIAMTRDITEIKRAQDALMEAREEALAASVAKTGFLSTMSHEIRTPMNAILGMAELLAETTLDSEQRRFVDVMQNNGNVLLALINDILDIAKIESGRLSLEQEAFQLEAVLDRVLDTFAARAHGKGLELVARIAPGIPPELIGDSLRLRQVLINLLGNAIKFTETGEVVLTVERDRGATDEGGLHFCIADTGIGIPAHSVVELFQSFTQADSSMTRRFGGSGLGLAIVKRLVELMGGRVWVESEVNAGSRFHFTARLQVAESPAPPESLNLTGTRILIVDDTGANRILLRELLSERGAQVTEYASGAEALTAIKQARARRAPYDLVLLDTRMPAMSGIELAERISARATRERVIPMVVADDLRANEARLRRLGLQNRLNKPIRKRHLFDVIDRALCGSNALRTAHHTIPPEVKPAPVAAPALRALRILLAEDSPDNRLLIKAFLRTSPHILVEAEDGAAAIARFKEEPFDLILMDIQMPVMDGLSATRAIREWESARGLPPTPIVALTASALGDDVQKCFDAGVTRHVAKPVRKAMLLETIQQLSLESRQRWAVPSKRPPEPSSPLSARSLRGC